jgi:putative serine protease PepD
MSTHDRPLPPRSPDEHADSPTHPLPAADRTAPGDTTDPAWPSAWTQASAQPPAPGQAWGQASSPPPPGPGWGEPPSQPSPGPGWGQPPPEPPAGGPGWGQPPSGPPGPPPAWGEGGGGSPTTPVWGQPPGGPASPGAGGRGRLSRPLAAAVAAVVLLAGGYGIGQALDRDSASATPTGAGIPTAVISAPIKAGDEPVAAVAKALLPTVVELTVQTQQGDGLGSGVIYDKNGYILTAAHVVEGADQVTVRLADGTRLRGQVLGTDTANDVGVVKVDRGNLPAAPLAVNVPLQVGQLAVAIGSPFRLEGSVTAGVVSATNRILSDDQGTGREVIQTDAPINPGNSGGVLADREGRVIGINSAIRSDGSSGGNIGIGFAVPIDVAARSATAIVQHKPLQTGFLGVSTGDPTSGRGGALVQDVTPNSPAAKAGLQAGDLVVALDGQAVTSQDDLISRIRDHKPGDRVTLKVVRNGKEQTATATLADRPAG